MPTKFNPFTGNLTPTPKPLSDSEIKEQYEANANTNAYTDTEKARLASLYYAPTDIKTANYQAVDRDAVYCDTSGGSFSVTLPTDGAVQIVDVVGVDADTGFGVNNVVVLPNAGQTVTGETSLELDVGATKIVFALFGTDWKIVDISAPQFVLTDWGEITNKPTYVDSATIDFTETETEITGEVKEGSIDESKLGINVNASLDLADSSVQLTGDQSIAGTKTFTTALILPNRSKINGVQHYYQNTKPDNPLELSVGDRWWNTTDGTEWFWNGTYWLGEKTYAKFFNNGSAIVNNRSVGGNATFCPASATGDVFVESLTVWGFVPTTNDATNKWQIRGSTIVPSAATSPTLTAFFDSTVWGASSSYSPGVTVINELIDVDYPIQSFALGLTKVGSPGNLTLSGAYILYRPVA